MSSPRRLHEGLLVVSVIVAAAFAAQAQKVRVGADPATDLTKYKTYGWSNDSAGANPVVSQIIIAAVDEQLAAKGLKKVETDPELTVSAIVWTESDMHVTTPSRAPVLNSISTGVVVGTQGWPVTRGMLVIDIADTKTKNGVWRGSASDTLKHAPTGNKAQDAKNVEKPIRKAVEKMFKQFPKP